MSKKMKNTVRSLTNNPTHLEAPSLSRALDMYGNLNCLIDSGLKETITVFRKFQLKRIEEYCASIHFPIHVQPCIDSSLNNIWAYNISKVFNYKRKEDNPQGGRYHY